MLVGNDWVIGLNNRSINDLVVVIAETSAASLIVYTMLLFSTI